MQKVANEKKPDNFVADADEYDAYCKALIERNREIQAEENDEKSLRALQLTRALKELLLGDRGEQSEQ